MQMRPRKSIRRYEQPQQSRFLTFSCYRRLPLFGNDHIKRSFVDRLAAVRARQHFRLQAWVVMPEHVHLLLVPNLPDFPVPAILHAIKQPFSRRVVHRWKVLNAPILDRIGDARGRGHFWQAGSGYDRNVRDDDEFVKKAEYIHANPVSRGLAARTVDYPWSSARWYAGDDDALIALDE